jgi:two-component system, NtrC family, sensor histidine kinase HydH
VSTRTTFSRAAPWLLIAAAVLMGVALLATVWSTYRSTRDASQTLARGQAEVLQDAVRFALVESDEPIATQLERVLETYQPEGLRYIALLDRRGNIEAAAGTAVAPDVIGPDRLRPGRPVEVGDRIRMMFRAATARTEARRPGRWRRQPMIIEAVPDVATDLRGDAARTLGIGAVASGALMVLALVLVRWFLRRQALERALEQERRLASLGQMSAVLAHEIRNPLASLKGNAQLLARALPESELPRRKADRVVDEAIRLERLTNDLLEFARTAELEREPVDPVALVREVSRDYGGQIEVVATSAPASWPLDRERMRQVLANLVSNAVQAAGGRVRATVAATGGTLEIEVRDWGPGIPAEDRGRIFEPFYTKRTRGTGLGLAISRRLVELHGGTIEAGDAADGGAVFRVRIPEG